MEVVKDICSRDDGGSCEHLGITEFKAANGRFVFKLFNSKTGEIFQDSSYEKRIIKNVSPLPRYAKDNEQALEFMTGFQRSLNENYYFDIPAFNNKYGRDMLEKFLSLTKKVVVHNVLFIDRSECCKVFECSSGNLNRKLNILTKTNLIKYTSKNLNKPKTIRILLNPSYFWRGSYKERLEEWRLYWTNISSCSSVDDNLFCMKLNDKDFLEQDVMEIEYDSSYGVGMYDDKHEMFGNENYANPIYLREHDLVYLLYGIE